MMTGEMVARPFPISGKREEVLPATFREHGFTVGVEVGTLAGEFAECLCVGVPGLRLACVDPWLAYPEYRDHRQAGQEKLDACYADAVKRLAPYGVRIIREFSVPAADLFTDGSLDFVYIDANHAHDFVLADIRAWTPKVRAGGIISGHDYDRVGAAVRECAAETGVREWFVTGDAHPSWLWVNP